MPIDTVESIAAEAARRLGDYDFEVFTLERMRPFVQSAYRALHGVIVQMGLPLADQTVYWVVEANTSVLVPSGVGISNIGKITPDGISERGGLSLSAISSIAADAAGALVTCASTSGIATGDVVTIANVLPASLCIKAPVTVIDSTTLRMNGLLGVAAYESGGYVVRTIEPDQIVTKRDVLDLTYNAERLYEYTWDGRRFCFHPAPTKRLLTINYSSNGEPPASGDIDIGGATDFLVAYSAARAAAAQGLKDDAKSLLVDACGPSEQPDATGGFLHQWVVPLIQEKNLQIRRPKPFRGRRVGTFWM